MYFALVVPTAAESSPSNRNVYFEVGGGVGFLFLKLRNSLLKKTSL